MEGNSHNLTNKRHDVAKGWYKVQWKSQSPTDVSITRKMLDTTTCAAHEHTKMACMTRKMGGHARSAARSTVPVTVQAREQMATHWQQIKFPFASALT